MGVEVVEGIDVVDVYLYTLFSFYPIYRLKEKPPLSRGLLFKNESSILSNCVFQSLSSLEGRNLHSRDGNLLRRVAWVDTHASCALADAERSEARDRHGVTLLQFFRDHAGHCLEGAAS